jgi:hypothetical protein
MDDEVQNFLTTAMIVIAVITLTIVLIFWMPHHG